MYGGARLALAAALGGAPAARALLVGEGSVPVRDTPSHDTVLQLEHSEANSLSFEELAVDVHGLDFHLGGRSHEVVLNGEPKSGTTWLEFVAKEILTVACEEDKTCNLVHNERTVTTETVAGMLTYSLEEKHTIPEVGHINKFDFTRAPVLTDAEVNDKVAKYLKNATTADKQWLVVFRDPRSVTLSSCYHMYKDCPDADTFSLKRIDALTKWINLRYRFFRALEDQVQKGRILILFYEDLRNDELGYVEKISNFMGVSLNKEQASRVQKATTMTAMKDLAKVVPQGGAASGKVREGATCGYKSDLSAEAAEKVTAKMRAVLVDELNSKWKC